MSCTNPMIGVPYGNKVGMLLMSPLDFIKRYCSKFYLEKYYDAESESERFEFYTSHLTSHLYEHKFDYMDKLSGRTYKLSPMYIPCGKCLGCRLDYSREWANRNQMESLTHDKESNFFVTLTYDDYHLVPGSSFQRFDDQDGETVYNPHYVETENFTLVPEHCQKFMKSLREAGERLKGWKDIRMFYCGEYGSQYGRPHYHFLLYNLPLDDLKIHKKTMRNDVLYNSPFLDFLWKKGFVVIAELNWQTCAYVSRYVMKKQTGGKMHKGYYNDIGLYQEFVRSSNRPGIGFDYYMQHMEQILEEDKIILPPINGEKHVVTPGRYFTKCVENSGRYDWMCKLSDNKLKRAQKADDMLQERHFVLGDDDALYFDDMAKFADKVHKHLELYRNNA